MDKQFTCYCGLYCEHCAVRARINPAAKVLHDEMVNAGFEEFINAIPGGDGFWPFLKAMAESGMCTSCRDGGGDPGCAVRICARVRGVEMCALCEDYPCNHFSGELFAGYPILKQDNALLREQGMDAWAKMQDERLTAGYLYTAE